MSVFGTLTATPATLNVSCTYSDLLNTLASAPNSTGIFIKVAPIDPSTNAVWNSTNLTALSLQFDNGVQPYGATYVKQAVTVTSPAGGATNITGTVTPANLSTAISALIGKGITSGNLALVAYDGTNYVQVALGKWNLSLAA